MTRKPVLAIGWDVGGWRGTRQGLAAVTVSPTGNLTAHCPPRARSLMDWPEAQRFDSVVEFACGGVASMESHRVVMGIDAPFGFPASFRRLLHGQACEAFSMGALVTNPYAFRRTDLSISERFKTPLSAAFDKLGNNASVAMHFLSAWRANGLKVLPFDADDGASPVAIEVYPAVAGPLSGVHPLWLSSVLGRPVGQPPDEHQTDALICAGLAMAYASPGLAGLPTLAPPEAGLPDGEGWIFAPQGMWKRP